MEPLTNPEIPIIFYVLLGSLTLLEGLSIPLLFAAIHEARALRNFVPIYRLLWAKVILLTALLMILLSASMSGRREFFLTTLPLLVLLWLLLPVLKYSLKRLKLI